MSPTVLSALPPSLPPAALPIARADFPSWLPATLVKELRQGLRTRGFVGTFIGFQILMAILMMTVAAQASAGNSAAVRAVGFSTANGFFWTILTLQLLIFTPARALGSLQLEVSSRTIDLLMLTRLDAWRIVTGKWASLVAQAALLLIAMLPYGIVRYFAGSVDLVSDAIRCVALLGGCALLTAAGLWGAGMGKAFRILGIIAMVMFSTTGSSIISTLGRSGSPFGAFGAMKGASVGLLWLDGALLLVFFLVAAVRNIAPRAENHTLLTRLLPLIALLPVPIATVLVGASPAMSGQLIVAGVFLLLVGAAELASLELPLLVHFRAARKRSSVPRLFLRMTLPGWPSAFLYALFATMLWLACAAVLGFRSTSLVLSASVARSIWIAVLALAALAFPSLVLSLLRRQPRGAGGVYLATLAAAGALTPIGYAFAAMSPKFEIIKTVANAVPVSSLIATLADDNLSAGLIAMQAILAVAVIIAAWWQTRPYWEHLAMLEARDRQTSP